MTTFTFPSTEISKIAKGNVFFINIPKLLVEASGYKKNTTLNLIFDDGVAFIGQGPNTFGIQQTVIHNNLRIYIPRYIVEALDLELHHKSIIEVDVEANNKISHIDKEQLVIILKSKVFKKIDLIQYWNEHPCNSYVDTWLRYHESIGRSASDAYKHLSSIAEGNYDSTYTYRLKKAYARPSPQAQEVMQQEILFFLSNLYGLNSTVRMQLIQQLSFHH